MRPGIGWDHRSHKCLQMDGRKACLVGREQSYCRFCRLAEKIDNDSNSMKRCLYDTAKSMDKRDRKNKERKPLFFLFVYQIEFKTNLSVFFGDFRDGPSCQYSSIFISPSSSYWITAGPFSILPVFFPLYLSIFIIPDYSRTIFPMPLSILPVIFPVYLSIFAIPD